MGERMFAVFARERPRKMNFPLKSVESSEFNEFVQIDHQKTCLADLGYNQIIVTIDHFTKLAEAVPCQTASAEVTCDHLITHWIWLSDDVPIRQRESLRWRSDKRTHEKIPHCTSTLDNLPPKDE